MSTIEAYITEDRECDHCGYNLKGLAAGGKCPECGTSIRTITTRSSGTMSGEAPTRFVRKLRYGFMLASVGIITGIVLSGSGLMFFSSFFWVAGIWITTSMRPNRKEIVADKVLDNDRFRMTVRYSSLAWPIYGLALLALITLSGAANPSTLLKIPLILISVVAGSIAWISLIPTCIYFAELGYWASHDHLAQRLRSTAWAMCVFGVGSVLLSAVAAINIAPSGAAGFTSGFTIFLTMVAVVVFFFTVLQLTSVMGWVIKHQKLVAGSPDRVRERVEREINTPGKIISGLSCRACGFDLDGLPHGGHCPECRESYADVTPLPIIDPAKMHLDRDESEIEIADGENKGIYFNQELDALGKPKATGTPFIPDESAIPLDGDIPLSEPETNEQSTDDSL